MHLRARNSIIVTLAVTACMGSRGPELGVLEYAAVGTADSSRRASSMVLAHALVAEIVGLPALAYSELPAGVREIRLELGCDLCMPQHLIRIVEDQEVGSVRGMVYTAFAAPSESVEEQLEIARAIRAAADSIALTMKCGRWEVRQLDFGSYQWCASPACDSGEWRVLLGELAALGVLSLGTELGYSPRPPTAEATLAAMRDSTVAPPDVACQDLGGRSLLIETLEGSSFRQAHLRCLEAPQGAQHTRAASALQLLREFAGIAGASRR